MKVMCEFIPKRIYTSDTHRLLVTSYLKSAVTKTGYYIRDSCILMRWPDNLDIVEQPW